MQTSATAAVAPDFFATLEYRLRRELRESIEVWGQSVTQLSNWEDDNLLDNPTGELKATHRRMLDDLIKFGKFLAITTDHPDFPDQTLRATVTATLQVLQDKIPLWHGTASLKEAEAILTQVFPE